MISKTVKLFMTAVTVCFASGVGFSHAAQRNIEAAKTAAVARSTTSRTATATKTTAARTTTNRTTQTRATTAKKTTTARVATNAVQSRSNSSTQKSVSKRAATTARAVRARAGETNQVVTPKSASLSGGNASVVKMYVGNDITGKYANLQKYVELSGNMGYVSLLKESNQLPNLITLFDNISAENTNLRIDGVFKGTDATNEKDIVYYDNGAAKEDTDDITPGSSINMIASATVGTPSEEPVSGGGAGTVTQCPSFAGTLTAWNSRHNTNTTASDVKRTVGANSTNVADCAIIVEDADGFCRMARWNGKTYGYYDGALTYADPVVNCDKQNSHLDGTVTVDVDADIDSAYSNMTFEAVRVGIEFGQPLPSLAPLNNNRSNKVITLSGVYKTRSMATVNGVQSGTGQIWGADGAPAVTSVSNMNSFTYSNYQKMYFAYAVWNKGAATVENTCSNKLSDYPGRMTGDTFIKPVQTTNQSTLAGIEDCAAIVHDSIGLCWALKMNNSARQLIPCENEKNTYNLGYGMARINQFTPSGYNPDTYESGSTYYFLPWQENYPVRLMNTYNNNYNLAIILRNPDYYYAQDENGNKGMLQLPDLTNYVNHLTVPAGKKFAGIYTMWEKNLEKTYHIDGTAGGDFTFTSTKIYDETGKPLVKYLDREDLPWTYPRLADTGGRPYYMFIIWEDASSQGDDSCPVFDKSVQGAAWNSITPTKYVRAKNAADRKADYTDCAIIYEDADGFCRIAPYKVQPAYQGLPAISVYTSDIYKGDGKWNISSPTGGPVVDCNKEYSDIDAELLVLTHAGGIKSAYDETQTLLFNQLRIGINYGETLPSLAPFVELNKYYSPNAVLVGGFSKNHMSAGGQPCAGISAGGCVSLPESEKYWGADGNPVKTIANQTEIQNNFDGHDGVYEPSLLWNTVNETVADCPVPTGVNCASGDTSCSNAKRYPHYWTQNGLMSSADVATFVQNSTFVRNVLLFGNTQNVIAKCGAIIRDGDGLCWVMENNRECTAGTETCMYRVMDCDLSKYTIESDGTLPWSAGGQRIKNIYIDDSWDMNGNGKGKLVTPTNPGFDGIIKILYQWGGDTSKNLVFPDLSGLVSNMEHYVWNSTQHAWEKSNKQFAGIYSNKDCSGTRYYDDTGKPIQSTMTFSEVGNMYMCWLNPSEPDPSNGCPINSQPTSVQYTVSRNGMGRNVTKDCECEVGYVAWYGTCIPACADNEIMERDGSCSVPDVQCPSSSCAYANAEYDKPNCLAADADGTYMGCVAENYRCRMYYTKSGNSCVPSCEYAGISDPNAGASNICSAGQTDLYRCIAEHCECKSEYVPSADRSSCVSCTVYDTNSHYDQNCVNNTLPAYSGICVAKNCRCNDGYQVEDGACVEEELSEPTLPDDYDCPSVDESLSSYANANANISDGHLLSAPDGETISSQSACTWMFTDGDGMCRVGTYTYKVGSKTYYHWNDSIVACNTTTIGSDHGFDVDVGPIMDTVPTAFWDQDYLRLEDRLTYRYDATLPSLKPYVDRAKEGSISGHYTFMGGYVGDSCSVTYSNGEPSIGSGCTRVYNDDGTPAKTLSSYDSDELTLAWDYSDNSWANYASICPTTRAEYNKDFNINSGYSFPEDEVSASCTVQRALVTSNNSVISPASDCAILCEDTLGVCYAKTTGQDNPRDTGGSTGMVSCDTTGYVDTTKSVRILDDGSEGNAINTVRYRTYLKDYAIRSGEHTIIFVQPSNAWPSVSNLIADLYHCGGANSHDGCTNGDDGKTFRGIYTEPNCAGTQIYDENGDYNTSTSVTYEDLPAVVWGDNDKKVYMCWQ